MVLAWLATGALVYLLALHYANLNYDRALTDLLSALDLRWNADDTALFFTIERRNESGVFGEIAVVPSGRTEWIGGRPYADYRVRAWNSVGKSLPSNVVR